MAWLRVTADGSARARPPGIPWRRGTEMLDASGTQHLLLAETLGLAMARRASDILERHRVALTAGTSAIGTGAAGTAPEDDEDQFACDNAIFTAVLDAANECLGRFDTRPADDRWCDALLQVIYLAQLSALAGDLVRESRAGHLGKPGCTGQDGYVRGDRCEGATMRAGASLGWRIATAVAFGATAALAVTLSRGAPVDAALTSAKGPGAQHAAASARPPAVTARCAASGLRISLGPGARVTAAITRYPLDFTNVSGAPCTLAGLPGGGGLPGQRRPGRRRRRSMTCPSPPAASCSPPGRPRTRPWTPRSPRRGAARSARPGCASSRQARRLPATSGAP